MDKQSIPGIPQLIEALPPNTLWPYGSEQNKLIFEYFGSRAQVFRDVWQLSGVRERED